MSFNRKLPSFFFRLLVQPGYSAMQNNRSNYFHMMKPSQLLPSHFNEFQYSFANRKLLYSDRSRSISFQTITGKSKTVFKTIKFYLTGFVAVFIVVYTFIYYSITTVLYEFLKLQSNSIPITQDESFKNDN